MRTIGIGSALAAALAAFIDGSPVQADTPIKIGILTELSGPIGTDGNNEKEGFLFYLATHGQKLGGAPAEVVIEDTAGDPNAGIAKAKKLVEGDKIDLMVGPLSSSVAFAIKGYLNQREIPTFVAATVDELFDGASLYCLTFTANPDWFLTGYLAGKAGYRKAVTLAPNFSAGQSAADYGAKGFTAAGGAVVQKLLPRLGTADYGPFISQFAGDADVGLTLMIGGDAIRFMKQYSDYGAKLPLFGQSAIVDESRLPAEGKAALGFVAENFYFSVLDTAENKAFVAAWTAAHPGASSSWYAVAGYTAGQILDAALAKSGKLDDKQAFTAVVKETKIVTPAGPFRFAASNAPIRPHYIAEIREVDGIVQPVVIATIPDFLPQAALPTLPPDLVIPKK